MKDKKSFNVAPIARNMIIETMSDLMIVLDAEDNLVDLNPAAARLLTLSPSQPVSMLAESLPAEWRALFGKYRGMSSAHEEINIGEAVFDIRISTITDEHEASQGRVILLRDVTSYGHIEKSLLR